MFGAGGCRESKIALIIFDQSHSITTSVGQRARRAKDCAFLECVEFVECESSWPTLRCSTFLEWLLPKSSRPLGSHMEKSPQCTSLVSLGSGSLPRICSEIYWRFGCTTFLPSCEKDASRQHVTIQAGHDFQFWHLSILSFCCVVEHSRFVMMHLIHGHLSSLCWQHAIFQKMATKWPIFFTWYNMYIVSFSSFYRYPPESKGRGGHVWYSGFCMVPCSWWCWSQGAWLGRCHA